eukprot:30849-Amphidinium_carterae.1
MASLRRTATKELTNLAKAQGAAYQYVLTESDAIFSDGSECKGKVSGIPLIHTANTKSTTPSFTHMLEIFTGLTTKPDISNVTETLPENLEPPLGFLDHLVNVEVQYYVTPDEEDPHAWTLIKHIINKGRVLLKRVNSVCTGELHVIDSKKIGASKHAGLVLQYLLDMIAIEKVACYTLQLAPPKYRKKNGESNLKSDEEIDAGFHWIAVDAPKSTSNNEHLIWLEKQKNNVASPVHGWKDTLVLQAIQNLINNRSLAHKVDDHPLTLFDLSPWALKKLVAPCL